MPVLDALLTIMMWLSMLGWLTIVLMITVGLVGGLFEVRAHCRDMLDEARRRRGLCVRCGYDLRCTPRQCPECGLAIRSLLAPARIQP